jgi:hypothetical protein
MNRGRPGLTLNEPIAAHNDNHPDELSQTGPRRQMAEAISVEIFEPFENDEPSIS